MHDLTVYEHGKLTPNDFIRKWHQEGMPKDALEHLANTEIFKRNQIHKY